MADQTPQSVGTDAQTKACNRCQTTKPVTEFYRSTAMADGLQIYCKPCLNAYQATYVKTTKGKDALRRGMATWRAKKAGLPTGRLPSMDTMKRAQRGLCAYCQKPLPEKFELEHVIPISKGGGTTAENCVLACKPCNRRKRTRTWIPQGMPLKAAHTPRKGQRHCPECNMSEPVVAFYRSGGTSLCKQCFRALNESPPIQEQRPTKEKDPIIKGNCPGCGRPYAFVKGGRGTGSDLCAACLRICRQRNLVTMR